ncbi:MAG TPA: YdeI/OmpD-associated family protein [Chitinophagaceae bacterium]|nr:YdeI/OmpD-associated family protein [Chitinophagaceae bacterium]
MKGAGNSTASDLRVGAFFNKPGPWKEELKLLRSIVLDFGLTEELKWYQPCYTFDGKNVLIISGFRDYCVLSFFKGALLKDTHGILQQPGENTQSARVIRFTSTKQIEKLRPAIRDLVRQAIQVEKSGLKVHFKKISEHRIPEEFAKQLKEKPALRKAFNALTPGRQRGYLLYISSARQPATREARVEKCIPLILEGKGLSDDYRSRQDRKQ